MQKFRDQLANLTSAASNLEVMDIQNYWNIDIVIGDRILLVVIALSNCIIFENFDRSEN